MDVSLLSSPPSASEEPYHTTYSVVLALLNREEHWYPKSCRTLLPVENGSLPLPIALELASHMNTTYREVGRNRVAVVMRAINGGKPRFGVAGVEAYPATPGGAPVIQHVKGTGLSPQQAIGEVERINTEILHLARVPKYWAIAIVEATGEGVSA